MIEWEEAYNITLQAARTLPQERVALPEALHRVLAQDVSADMDMPPFDKVMVDGYACRRADLGTQLEVVEVVPAGVQPERNIESGKCAKVMTGGMMPDGADCVFMVEQSEESENGQICWTGDKTADNIARRAQDIKQDEVLLREGHHIRPADLAVLASMGCVNPHVYQRPQVGIIATGNELVEPDKRPQTSQIRNSNAYQLCGQVEAMGAIPHYCGIATDDEDSLNELIASAIADNDVVVLSGGVSMGDFDLVPGALKRLGIQIQFDKIAVQPGKPTVFGYSDDAYCFGLPGNPVSTFVSFELLVKPFLYKLMGHDFAHEKVVAPLGESLKRKAATRMAWIPVILTDDGKVKRVEYHGSAHINALSHAQGLTAFPIGVDELPEEKSVDVLLLGS